MKKGLIITLIILGIIIIGGTIGWPYMAKEHEEAKNVAIDDIDFSKLKDGIYTGEYEGGMYKWRANKTEVTVETGRVTNIKLLNSTGSGVENNKDYLMVYDRIIKAQSLQVDTVNGATLTTKAYLKAVEIALKKAQ